MNHIQQLIQVLLYLIPGAAALRAIFCLIIMATHEDTQVNYKGRLRNLLFFVAIAESCTSLISVVLSYFL